MDDPVSSKSYESGVQMLQQAANKMDELLDNIYKYIFGHIVTQMSATAGIKKHGQAAVDALLQEFCQLDSKNVFEPLAASTLTASQKQEARCAVNLKEAFRQVEGAHVRRRSVPEVQIYEGRDDVSSFVIADSGMDASKVAPTPAKKDLFTVDNGSEQLDKRQGDIFHNIVAKLL
jgi:hypothetical protein